MTKSKNPFNRRVFMLTGGATLLSLTTDGILRRSALAHHTTMQNAPTGVTTLTGAKKPVYVPMDNSTDPMAYSLADSLFWLDQEWEHAKFYQMLMPPPDLETQRNEAKRFESTIHSHLDKVFAARGDRGGHRSLNQSTIEIVKRFMDFKDRMLKAQDAGQLKSLVWPTFFQHTMMEAEYFVKRLEGYNNGKIEYDRNDVINFWSQIMAEHADFIAHLLDPKERMLFEQALKARDQWEGVKSGTAAPDTVKAAADEMVAFKKTAGQGIETGAVDSIIHPTLADHVLREALKFTDELKRARIS